MHSALEPIKLRSDNFTPPTRTPWGGARIVGKYKRGLVAGVAPQVGESWEVSVEPSFPSRTVGGEPLPAVLARDPVGWLGVRVAERFGGQLPLLVKLVDAAMPLSVQVHPRWGDATLSESESGKLEMWLILDADAGSGIYLGFREGVDEGAVRACLEGEGALDQLMNFVPVLPGEAYVIRPGTPHALGQGITLVEPQLLTPPRVAATYRYWDWNRRYDELGRPSASGKPRTIDVARSLAVTDWSAPRGDAFVERCRAKPSRLENQGLTCAVLPPDGGLSVRRWEGSGSVWMTGHESAVAFTCVGGSAEIAGKLVLACGESALVPAALDGFRLALEDAILVQSEVEGTTLPAPRRLD